jgi:hypothetical protein
MDLYKAEVLGCDLICKCANDWNFTCKFNQNYANFCDSSYYFVEGIVTKGIEKSWV